MRRMIQPPLAILYEHPEWFRPLFAALDARGILYRPLDLTDHRFDPESRTPPAPVILSRVAMSGFLRDAEHGIFYASALLDHWRACGARVLNGADVLAVDASKARQLSLIAGLGLGVPRTRVVHRPQDVPAAAAAIGVPLLVKANIGGAGAGIARYHSIDDVRAALADGTLPQSIDKVLLVQELVPARGGTITRIETVAGHFLYALEIESGGAFDLCPADACVAAPGRAAIRMAATEPTPNVVAAAERIAQVVGMDVGGVELMIDDRDGVPRFYDINALSNFVARPLDVLGWDPHERLVDYLEQAIAEQRP